MMQIRMHAFYYRNARSCNLIYYLVLLYRRIYCDLNFTSAFRLYDRGKKQRALNYLFFEFQHVHCATLIVFSLFKHKLTLYVQREMICLRKIY